MFFEDRIFLKKQFNLLNSCFNNQSVIIKKNYLTIILKALRYLIFTCINFKYQETILYIIEKTRLQFFSYLNIKRHQNI